MSPKKTSESRTTAARSLVAELARHGVDRIFCVPGESFLSVLDALVDHPTIRVVTCRHEGGAAMMAEAWGKLTGRPGVVFATRAPGATNASAGIHVARQDSTPMILFVGQIARDTREREAFQEIDLRATFSSLAKWATEIDLAARVPEIVARAFQTATSGRPGPVVVGLPEDMLEEEIAAPAAHRYQPSQARMTTDDAKAVTDALGSAKNPVMIVGGGGWSADAARLARRFSEAWKIPAVATFRCQDYIDNRSDSYIGNLGLGANPGLVAAIRDSDLVLAIGTRLEDVSTNSYSLFGIPLPEQRLIHVHADAGELGRVYQPWLGIVSSAHAALLHLAETAPRARPGWHERTQALRQGYLAWTTPPAIPGPLQMGAIVSYLRDRLPDDATITNGAGNFAIWPNRFFRYHDFGSMLAPTSGSMGYAVPSAVAAKLAFPERIVVAFTGDGDFLMTGQELATAAREQSPVIVIVVNNGMYGTIRMHQEMHFPGRVSATTLTNPDFVKLAEAYGAMGERITHTEQFASAFEAALSCGRSALLELVLDPDIITPTQTITALRAAKHA